MSLEMIVCPSCLALNPIEKEDLCDHSKCGECQTILLPDLPIDANATLFKHLKAHSTLPIIIDFWGAYLGGSHEMSLVFNHLAHSFKGDAVFIKVDSEEEQVLANEFNLSAIPTFILIKEGKEYHRLAGNQIEANMHAWLARYLRIKRKYKPSITSF